MGIAVTDDNTFDDTEQSNGDWWDSYDGKPANGAPPPETPFGATPETKTITGEFCYVDHRTTRLSRLILEFKHRETGIIALMFFNVDLRKYPARPHGQFVPPKEGKFRRFFIYALDQPPLYWCRAHRELYKLKDVLFTGTATRKKKCWELGKIVRRKRSQSAVNQQSDSSIFIGGCRVGTESVGGCGVGGCGIGGKIVGTGTTDNTVFQQEKPETRVRADSAPTMCGDKVRLNDAEGTCALQPPDNLATITPDIDTDTNTTAVEGNPQPGDDDIEVEIS